ncbi:RED-like protein N-terminal region-domain-containing protein [Cristinia sonorae]|uniref:RED-like protein N-terminal region-domain-containing protein n=1 Tax=Cristinia sonorae TaxID=1940300 RepID=A0A8K0UWA7_9AGAR|nr:RED-like protein N-terminal region-domain-containing protein [Cristinia sonorae]
MDQDSFRQLLSSAKPVQKTQSSSKPPTKSKACVALVTHSPCTDILSRKKSDGSEPAFKPRTVKKTKESAYRDRASERRLGKDSDYAQVEALAEDFEKRAAAENAHRLLIEEQRKYLGGDSDHTVLVKGLDFALLEQNKARAAASGVDDDTLEQAFIEGTGQAKKRTREDIVRDLKNKRTKTDDTALAEKDVALEEAKKMGKFKPIGFKPIGGGGLGEGAKGKKKGKKEKDGSKKKKSQKDGVEDAKSVAPSEHTPSQAGPSQATPVPTAPEPEPVPEDFDIFADAGEYTGLDLEDDDEDDDEGNQGKNDSDGSDAEGPPLPVKANWFDDGGDKEEGELTLAPPNDKSNSKSASPPPVREEGEAEDDKMEEDEEDQAPMRLVPLASSSIPSIKDILAMDDDVKKYEKRKAKKEKKKSGLGAEGKVDRDYQRLKSYTEKKAAAS